MTPAMPTLTALFAAVLALVYVRLAMGVIRARRAALIALGVGEDPALLKASRAHANFAEYVPLYLLLMGFAEVLGAHWAVIAALGLALLAGRLLHARALDRESIPLRVRGMQLTLYGLIAASFVVLLTVAWNAARGVGT
jgi:uncharacterized membrane protein YecN with MAPEG domain